jgi:hypothetical protein
VSLGGLNVVSCVRASGCPDSSSSSSFVRRPQYQIRRGPLRVAEMIEQCWVEEYAKGLGTVTETL